MYVEKKLRKIVKGHIKGFTTIELVIVIVITGIMAAVVIPQLASNNIDLYNVTRQVKSDIRYTQELAMSKYRQTKIEFTADSKAYYIKIKTPSWTIIESKELPERSKAIFSAGSTLEFTFNAYGEPITGGGGTLTISSVGSNEQIMVSNITGMANIL